MSEYAPLIAQYKLHVDIPDYNFFGVTDQSLIWLNTADKTALLVSCLVWILICYTIVVSNILAFSGFLRGEYTLLYSLLALVTLWAHLVTMCTNPGTVPKRVHPIKADVDAGMTVIYCNICDTFKPPRAHHDKISNRCISRFCHFCPWLNNAIGARNQKNFLLFLVYLIVSSFYLLTMCVIQAVRLCLS